MRSININLDEIVIDFEKNHERYYNEIISNTSITKKEKKTRITALAATRRIEVEATRDVYKKIYIYIYKLLFRKNSYCCIVVLPFARLRDIVRHRLSPWIFTIIVKILLIGY